MALNLTPLSAYKLDVLNGERIAAMNRAAAAQGIGALAGLASRANYEEKARDFFAQFDDSEEEARIVAQIKTNEDRIQELKDELQALGGE
jgi:diphthamide synthase subunit DPH2